MPCVTTCLADFLGVAAVCVLSAGSDFQGWYEGGGEDLRVAGGDCEIAAQCLSDDYPVERVAVIPGKSPGEDRVFSANGQVVDPHRLQLGRPGLQQGGAVKTA